MSVYIAHTFLNIKITELDNANPLFTRKNACDQMITSHENTMQCDVNVNSFINQLISQ
jgi:hypothetical protein